MEHALDTSNTPTWITIVVVLSGLFSVLSILGFVGFRWKDGLWGAILVAFNLVFAGLITMNYYELIAIKLATSVRVGLFYWDCLVFWVLILITYSILTMITNRISRVIVTFPQQVELSVKPLVLVATVVLIFVPIVFFVVQIGATAPKPIAGRMDHTKNQPTLLEQVLPQAMKTASKGSLSTLNGPNEFDPSNDFLIRHYNRRCALFEELWKTRNSRFSGNAEFL
ncbi:MAG: hypothetical protein FWH27_05715 [Planctomycetaceae bacterium]|nr:hypothetical protein [Planctomycetaceae bacterium]